LVASFSGHWVSSTSLESLSEIKGELFKIPIAGELKLERSAKKHTLTGHFGVKNAPLTPTILRACRLPFYESFRDGRLKKLSISLSKSWDPARKFSGLPQFKSDIAADNLHWNLTGENQLQAFSSSLVLRNETLQVHRGTFVFRNQPVSFSGKVLHLFSQPEVDATPETPIGIPEDAVPTTNTNPLFNTPAVAPKTASDAPDWAKGLGSM